MTKIKSKKYIYIGTAIIATCAILYFGYMIIIKQTPPSNRPTAEDTSHAGVSDVSDASATSSAVSSIPDISPNDSISTRPFERIDFSKISPTVLSESEIIESMEKVLDGLMKLDKDYLKFISMRTTTGDYNPTYYMLAAAIENPDIHNAFLNASSKSQFKVLSIVASGTTNTYSVRVKCITPYLYREGLVFAAGKQSIHYENVTPFALSGAAKRIADIDLSAIPVMTDIVTFTIFMEGDEPVILHPISENYGSRIPQYAFLWGGQVFHGIVDGDLLISNGLGGMIECNEAEFSGNHRNSELVHYLNECLAYLMDKDFNMLREQTLGGDCLGNAWLFTTVLPGYQKAFLDYPGLENEVMERIGSISYVLTYFVNEPEAVLPQSAVLLTVSLKEPSTGGNVIFTDLIAINPAKRGGLTGFDAELINGSISNVIENTLGGNLNQLNLKLLAY